MPEEWTDPGPADPVAILTRWADAGAIWRVLGRRGDRVTVGLYQCTGGEEVDRFTSGDAALLAFLGDRRGSDD
ncbi:hypothetical protein [Nocardia aurantia]|uniref:Uncharacterized protein n=1 Tax=Nocardia aurantia TaxID=2585199 RepID=A0A7K0DSL0_9NOCA|nr:hypothetical protein [Nocardia aurantia]MQY28749.1 hypothetical protein [Nocardia aurantia]